MKRSPMLDAVLVAAFIVAATALMAFVRGAPERCPQASPASVEGLFAPCLVADRREVRPPTDIAGLDLPPPPIERGGTAVARQPAPSRDVEATGSVPAQR
jgi:hypothetical protein